MIDNRRKRILGLVSAAFLGVFINGDCSPLDCGSKQTAFGFNPSDPVVVIADTGNNRLVRINSVDGGGWTPYSTAAEVRPSHVNRIAVDGQNRIYYTDAERHSIVRIDDLAGHGMVEYGFEGSDHGQFSHPEGIAIDSTGRIYIADSYNSRLVRMDDMTGAGWVTFGSRGSNAGQFDHPQGIALDPGGRIYVADSANNRVVRIDDMAGNGWTSRSSGTHISLGVVVDVALDSRGAVYVADNTQSAIIKIPDLASNEWEALGAYGAGVNQFRNVIAIGIDSADKLYIPDTSNDRLVRVDDISGRGWTVLDLSQDNAPVATDVAPAPAGRLMVAMSRNLVRFDGMDGSGRLEYGGNSEPKLLSPSGVALDDQGKVYVADTHHDRIFDGLLVDWSLGIPYGQRGSGIGRFNSPAAVAVDKLNRIYIADTGNSRIVRIDNITGTGYVSFGHNGGGVGEFSSPAGISVDEEAGVFHIYVADTHNDRIVRMDDMSGSGWIAYGTLGGGQGQFHSPRGVAARESSGGVQIFIADTFNDRIVLITDMRGANWTAVPGSGPSRVKSPSAVSVGRRSKLVRVADEGNHRIIEFAGLNISPGTGGQTIGHFKSFKSFGSQGAGEAQFYSPGGVDGN